MTIRLIMKINTLVIPINSPHGLGGISASGSSGLNRGKKGQLEQISKFEGFSFNENKSIFVLNKKL